MVKKSKQSARGPVKPTRFPELSYQRQGTRNWRILDVYGAEMAGTEPNAIGPNYKSESELLGDLERYAANYGCNPNTVPPGGW